ncbi:NADH-FMN oxidoreductase RutF, flavin reductase (DIM6/NTAB) family [Raineyella antarctica]|uniref:NADH-FMN oxidoreductase RutF, flavin reductase (DIM6/NTAB) family n=1 Tax=Raineyella antarctica TaxID=1577474 RepID=A0A1G6GXL1_9ACTN|nr:flavin reductase family protein [Raineyella antarctica]SDB86674.1 NADH-FMN oxidoreductase RutF, flavin reductase (DIM6/NTAB) family [Raineyella antarctica]
MTVTTPVIDPAVFREVLGHYPTGVTIVTGIHPDGEELAMVVGTFTSVSLDPPLVAFLPMLTSRTFVRLRECPTLCINVLTGDQERVGRQVAKRWENKLEGLAWTPSPSGAPILEGSLAWLDVRLTDVIEAGDHYIALCAVDDLGILNPSSPLLFFQGGYGRFAVPSLLARIDADLSGPIRQAELARDEIEGLAQRFGCEAAVLAEVNQDELATVASAVGPGIDINEAIGVRIPLIPPLGDLFVASSGPEAEEHWLERAIGADEGALQGFRDRLAFVRRNGYSLSFLPEEDINPYLDMAEATRIYSSGDLTPAQERAVRDRISRAVVCYRVRGIEAGQRYDVGAIVVPVKDAHGNLCHILRMSQLPRDASGQTVRLWIEALQAAAKRVSARMAECRGRQTA